MKGKVKVTQSCLTLCDPIDYTVHGILQARILEWVTCPFSRESYQLRSPALQVDALPAEPQEKPSCSIYCFKVKKMEHHIYMYVYIFINNFIFVLFLKDLSRVKL